MPIISHVGSKSIRVRAVYGTLFVVLLIGAASMIYPLILMLTGSVKSAADCNDMTAYPPYWFEELPLFQKYAESKYNGSLDQAEIQWGQRVGIWDKIPAPTKQSEYLDDFLEWRKDCHWWWLGHTNTGQFLQANARIFRAYMQEKYKGNLDAFATEMKLPVKSWNDVRPPPMPNPFRFSNQDNPLVQAFLTFAQTRPIEDRAIINFDGRFTKSFLMPTYTENIGEYNKKHGSAYGSYNEILLTRRAPASGLTREDWDKFVREQLSLDAIRIDESQAATYRTFISSRYENIAQFNAKFKTSYASFNDLPFPHIAPGDRLSQVDWEGFLRSDQCPTGALEVYGSRQAFEEFVSAKRGIALDKVPPIPLPTYEADYHDTQVNHKDLRWEFSTRNYKHVLEYVVMHGDGVWNTFIYCALAILTSLIVNPLAAYSLSRFKPPSTYSVLLFCMATMAFPGEVTMIPGFLLKRSFPVAALVGGTIAFVIAWIILGKVKAQMQDTIRALISLGVAMVAGLWIVPVLVGDIHVSLLNTFAALVLPSMANGFSIFLLKGFFDSLPQELYEAAEIDGASEWTKFWTFTMALSKPILAVTALDAFNGAYSAFMVALIIIPDQRMWTLMVWLYQLQSQVHPAVVFAALVIAAVPTLLVFIFCQNLIMRGIVVPTEK